MYENYDMIPIKEDRHVYIVFSNVIKYEIVSRITVFEAFTSRTFLKPTDRNKKLLLCVFVQKLVRNHW